MPAAEEQQKSTFKEERDLVSWTGPSRPFKRRDKEFYVTLVAIAAIVGLVLFLVEGWAPVILIVSLVFLFYILNTVEPESIEYKITTRGIKVSGNLTVWEGLIRFWFAKRFDNELLVIETTGLPGRMEIVIAPEKKEEIKKALLDYIPQEEALPSFLDRSAGWFSKILPGNR